MYLALWLISRWRLPGTPCFTLPGARVRREFLGWWVVRRWRLPATPCFTLPVAVSLKRFLTPLLVLSLGIFVSCVAPGGDVSHRTRQPSLAGPMVFPTIWKGGAPSGESLRTQGSP